MRKATLYIGLCLGVGFGGSYTSAQSLPDISIPIYGNWCGLDHPKSFEGARRPVDVLDNACRTHDYCVAAQGDFDCGCDIGFMNELRGTQWAGPVIAGNARAVYDGIAMKPCNRPDGMAVKQSMFMADMMRDMANGRMVPLDVMDRWRRLVIGD